MKTAVACVSLLLCARCCAAAAPGAAPGAAPDAAPGASPASSPAPAPVTGTAPGPATASSRPPFLDDILRQCDVKDQESLDSCLYHVLNSIRPFLPEGIPEWHIPPLEPMVIKGVSLNQGGGNTRIRAMFKDLKVSGLSNYIITYVKSSPADYKFTIGLQFPKLHTKGEYTIFGNLLLIPIKGQGPFWADFKNVTADSYNWLNVQHLAGSSGPGRLHLSQTKTDFAIDKVQLRLEHLFNDDEFLGETVNTFLNENAHDIIREVKPQFAQEIDRVVRRCFSEAISTLPVDFQGFQLLAAKGDKGGKGGPPGEDDKPADKPK